MIGVVLTNRKRLYGLTEEQKQELMQRLTFENPNYERSALYTWSGRPSPNIPRYFRYYEDKGKYFEVPLHYPVPWPTFLIKDKRVVKPVKWPELKVKLRPGQQKAFEAYMSDPSRGQIVLDTGEGKTILAYAIAAALGQKMLVLVDRAAYMDPWFDDLIIAFDGAIKKSEVGLIKGRKFSIGKYVTVAFFQTLYNRDLSQLSKEFGIIVHDESDTAAAPTRYAVVDQFYSKYRLAISGTVERSDGMHFLHKYLYGDFAVNLQGQGQNILRGSAVQIRRVETGFWCKEPRKFQKFRIYNGEEFEDEYSTIDYNKLRQLEAADEHSNKIKLYYICGALDQGESCLVLTHLVKHAAVIAMELKRRGYKCRLLTGSTPDDLKSEIIHQADRGEIQCVVSTFQYIKRGANVRRWTRIFALTQTANETELRQAIGRGRRIWTQYLVVRDKKTGKKKVIKREKKLLIWYDFTAQRIPAYRRQAARRLALWNQMGFTVKVVHVPPELRRRE